MTSPLATLPTFAGLTGRRVQQALSLLSAATLTAVGTIVAVAVMVGTTAAPAQARFDDTQKWGYAKVIEPEAYLRYYVHYGIDVVHVDEEHMTSDGFWFAHGGADTPNRDFTWQYQPFGAWCTDTTLTVQWNPWLNTHTCMPDLALSDAEYPGFADRTATCRAATGQPWKFGSPFAGDTGCTNVALGARYVEQDPGTGYTCAPWEDQGLTPAGTPKCLSQRYAWETAAPNSYWSPAPDTCTGMPAEATKRYLNPDLYAPTGPVPDCTGDTLASNCPANSAHQACTGVPRVIHSATASSSATVGTGTATATATKTAEYKAVVYKVTKTAKATYKGKTYKAKRTVTITAKANRPATVSVTVNNGTASRAATATCTGISPAAAQSCAQARAASEAARLAHTAADEDASVRAKAQAAQDATAQATAAAQQAVKATKVSKAQKTAAAKKAIKQARKAVQRQIAKAKKR